MAIIKCKMCGGDLVLVEGSTVATCEFCGTTQTVPSADNEKKLTLFARANRLRSACEFDKAAGIYESIVADFPEEAEAYWGLVLCKYGIEYVDDPGTGKKIPTCHRSSFDSITDDSDYEQALENADTTARKVYRSEAKEIETIRKGIIAVSANEDPYDIFICYKETDENGDRTLDSVLAQDIYDTLTNKGYRTFFARITLEDKLGQEYEPYIFAALNSAKIMLVVGTDYEYYNAVWVKNEWSRFLKLMANDKSKHLIPCYKGIDAYDIPKEFARLQAQDLGKVGAMQDLLRGIDKILPKKMNVTTVIENQHFAGPGVDSLMRRAQLYLENSEWDEAGKTYDKILDMDVENVDAHVGKLCAEYRVTNRKQLDNCKDSRMEERTSYRNAIRFASPGVKKELQAYAASARKHAEYSDAMVELGRAKEEADFRRVSDMFTRLGNFLDSPKRSADCATKANELLIQKRNQEAERKRAAQDRLENLYQAACKSREEACTAADMMNAHKMLADLGNYKDAALMAQTAKATAERMRLDEKVRSAQEAKEAEEKRKAARIKAIRDKRKKKYRFLIIAASIVLILFVYSNVINYIDDYKYATSCYNSGIAAMESGNYYEAITYFNRITNNTHISGVHDVQKLLAECIYAEVKADLLNGDLDGAKAVMNQLPNSNYDEINAFYYGVADELMLLGEYDKAYPIFDCIGNYQDANERSFEAQYKQAEILCEEQDYSLANLYFSRIPEYKDSKDRATECHYLNAISLCHKEHDDRRNALIIFNQLGDYKDSAVYIDYIIALQYASEDLFSAESILRQLPQDLMDVKVMLDYIDNYQKWNKVYTLKESTAIRVYENETIAINAERGFQTAKLLFQYDYSATDDCMKLNCFVALWKGKEVTDEFRRAYRPLSTLDFSVLSENQFTYDCDRMGDLIYDGISVSISRITIEECDYYDGWLPYTDIQSYIFTT